MAGKDSLQLLSQESAGWFRETFGEPTKVQQETWPAIAAGKPVLVSAPTGTGKTLSAFLVFLDRLFAMEKEDALQEEVYVIYISPLKSLAGDIRENLRRPLEGIGRRNEALKGKIQTALRTGDTPPKERQYMIKHPPHVLITTPESLYLMLTSKSGQGILKTARAVIIDELHALIDTKRGAHLMLSLARLDKLCGQPLQRIGLSATIEPLSLAAEYLSPEPAVIVAPEMEKKIHIEVSGTIPAGGKRKDPVWEELAKVVYDRCRQYRSVIAFCEGRRYAEKLGFYVNEIAGEGFARVHHGSLSREQRMQVENQLRDGSLRLLCATSSMELGIDVGDIDLVLQVGCPRTVSSTMQRLGRAGHNPGRISVMYMYPRTAPEALYCGMTAQVARQGGVELAKPPRMCLDVLAQHLVSMTGGNLAGTGAGEPQGYSVEEVMELLKRTYSFREVTAEDVRSILRMLAGDYEHRREVPVRPRILYDRINDRVWGDAYSRMLAVAAGGTIPDKGLYTAKTEEGVTVGELDEEFVYETRIGDRIILGSFAWRILRQDKDNVVVAPAPMEGARLPFWKGEIKGRSLRTGLFFGKIFRELSEAMGQEQPEPLEQGRVQEQPELLEQGRVQEQPESFGQGRVQEQPEPLGQDRLQEKLWQLGLDETARENAADFLRRQVAATGCLPDDRTIIMEHFTDQNGSHQVMVHSLFGRRVNAPMALLVQFLLREKYDINAGCVDEEDGFLLYPYGEERLPERLLYSLEPERVREILETILPLTPVFNMTFRYNAARALMMGMKQGGRQPLWLQRLRSTEMLDSLRMEKGHPLIRETRRECLEDLWDIDGVIELLQDIHAGIIAVRELYVEMPSPMSLPLQWQVEAAEMYEYSPVTTGLRQTVYEEMTRIGALKPSQEALSIVKEKHRQPQDEQQLHSLLMIEGDITVETLIRDYPDVPLEWLENLAQKGQAMYVEPGLWIAAEQQEEYKAILLNGREDEVETKVSKIETEVVQDDKEDKTASSVVRRLLYYRGPQTVETVAVRYCISMKRAEEILDELCKQENAVKDEEIYYHAKQYHKAQKATIRILRAQAVTHPRECYAALMAERVRINASPAEQLVETMGQLKGIRMTAEMWENIVFPRRVRNYREDLLDKLLAQGEYLWHLEGKEGLCFYRYEDMDWEKPLACGAILSEEESIVYEELCKRGASFLKALSKLPTDSPMQDILLGLAEKGLVYADSFVPVRQWQTRDKWKKASVRQRVNVRVMALSAGRWDVMRQLQERSMEEWLEQLFDEKVILCRETFRKPYGSIGGDAEYTWGRALECLRIWEYTGRVRRGYFVEGMSGAQFIRKKDYEGVMHALGSYAEQNQKSEEREAGKSVQLQQSGQEYCQKAEEIIWLNAADPAQVWGKCISHREGAEFLNVPGTVVALCAGEPILILERKGRSLRIPEREEQKEEGRQEEKKIALKQFAEEFRSKRIFPDIKRLIIKEYPPKAEGWLREAGFLKEMQDYVLYR